LPGLTDAPAVSPAGASPFPAAHCRLSVQALSSKVVPAPFTGEIDVIRLILELSCLLPVCCTIASADAERPKIVIVVIETEKGDIEVELDPAKAPNTVANFLKYVDDGFYNGGRFHRTVTLKNQPDDKVKIEVVQAGIDPKKAKDEFPPIKLERTDKTGLVHKDGAISMARDGPDTATSDFFICIGDQPGLDFGGKRNPDGQGFAAFGRVVKGMEVVKKIQSAPADKQALDPPVKIVKIARKR
jgi:peptidyl-prolyl cis-trans isomerase A (cyclophilin A)